jgi:hypothetical protein
MLRLEYSYPQDLPGLAIYIRQPSFPAALRRFVYQQRHPDAEALPDILPQFSSKINVFHSAVATFYAPSDTCGVGGMQRERIRSNCRWKGAPRRDTVFVAMGDRNEGNGSEVMGNMLVARVLLFFSYRDPVLHGKEFPCALVNWFMPVSEERNETLGMWEVKEETVRGEATLEVIHLDSVVRGAHLLPHYGSGFLTEDFDYRDALDVFRTYFVNHFVNYHTHELLQTW